jgi:hypothetical protein
MKILLIAFMLTVASVSYSAETNKIVFLGEFGRPQIRKDWIAKNISDVVGKTNISQFLIIQSMSSAPLELHTRTIKRWLQEGVAFQEPKIEKPMTFYFDTIVLMKDGRRFRIRINRSWLCLTSSKGSGYIFTGKGESSNN